jgi:hypothetical protein
MNVTGNFTLIARDELGVAFSLFDQPAAVLS